MGNTQPTNKTGKKATAQKLENAKKVGVLSLSDHSLDKVPAQVFDDDPEMRKLRTLDLSKNNLQSPGPISVLTELKSLNLDNNNLYAGSLGQIKCLSKLQNLSVAVNKLGKAPPQAGGAVSKKKQQQDPLPELPVSLKQVNLASNFLATVPRTILSPSLTKLEKLDLSHNLLAAVPVEIVNLVNLHELNLDSNTIVSIPKEMGGLKKLKVLSLRDNNICVTGGEEKIDEETNPQPLPKSLFTDTLLIDLNLHGNPLTNTQLNQFDGFQEFLDRRQKVKSKTLTNLSVCGLK